jgi:MarR family transcriptional regulator, organic hydroperoxide resistance regulator
LAKGRANAKAAKMDTVRFAHLRLEETVGFLLSDTVRTMTRTFSARIASHGVGMGIFQFLRVLWEEDGLTQVELADRTRMRGASAAGALHELERRGFVRRIADSHDRRKIRVMLTPKGRQLYDLVMPDIDVTNRAMLAGFDAAEQRVLKSMLHRMRRNLAAASAKPPRREKQRAGSLPAGP